MNLVLQNLLKGKDPEDLIDVIELQDGTRISGIVLEVGRENIQYFTNLTMKCETIPTDDITSLYLDNATITIPFPLISIDVFPD